MSEGMVSSNSPPKLEDFLGGATMETHQYSSHEREAMALSLDSSIYCQQNAEPETNREQSHLEQFSVQTHPHPYYTGIACHGNIFQPPLEEEDSKVAQLADCPSPPIPQMGDDDELPCLKNWVARHYSTHNALEPQQMNSSIVDDATVTAVGCGDLQSLSLSMSPGSQSSCVTAPRQISPASTECVVAIETKKRGPTKVGQKQPVHRKSIDTFGQRTSQYRGVTRFVISTVSVTYYIFILLFFIVMNECSNSFSFGCFRFTFASLYVRIASSRHRWTGRYEAHLWDNSCKKEGQTRKGRQGRSSELTEKQRDMLQYIFGSIAFFFYCYS